MKKIVSMILLVCLLAGSFSGMQAQAAGGTDKDFRAVWVSTVLNLDFPSKKGLTVDQMKQEVRDTVARAKAIGLNAVVLQVRPNADALYKSDLFPWSEYLTGSQGIAPANGFDPLAYWIEQCHANGLELHAWINPYRVTHTSHKRTDVSKLAAKSPARQNPSWVLTYGGALYFDPGLPETQKLVIDGVKEIITKYDVDGIHLDDYFYPGTDFPDDISFKKYGSGMTKADWRRENVNTLIKGIQAVIRQTKPSVRFGVSPFAIWQNKSTSAPLGSDTRGAQAYVTMYADTRRWVKEGWLDYIAPQIYWLIGYEIADYQKVLTWWIDVCKGTGVDLYVGHASYREAEGQTGWANEMTRQLTMNNSTYKGSVQGSIFFRSNNLKGTIGDQIAKYYGAAGSTGGNTGGSAVTPAPTPSAPASVLKMTTLTVAQPSGNASTTGSGYNILGTCDPDKELLMNGVKVENRTAEGFFSVYVPIAKGTNTFTFTQPGQATVTRTITGTTPSTGGGTATMSAANVTNPYPSKDEYVFTGNSITFKCTAPVGATVTVKLDGKTYTMTDDNAAKNKNLGTDKIYSTTYSYKLGLYSDQTGNVENRGKPTYSMTYKGVTKTAAGASVWVIQPGAPLHAGVTADSAWLYPNSTTDGGSSWLLPKGARDTVTAVTKDGTWVKLGCGYWVERANVSVAKEPQRSENVLSQGRFIESIHEDIFQWVTKQNPATYIAQSGQNITIQFGLQAVAPPHGITNQQLAANSKLFKSITSGVTNGIPYVTLTLKDNVRTEGWYTSFAGGKLNLHFKAMKPLAAGDKPLTGFSFVIDAGHGGSDSGATGPMGGTLAEKHINLANATNLANRLRALGAGVLMVRTADEFYSLYERTEASRKVNPDMFISMHSNSMGETTNAANIRGISFWYRNALSKPLADRLITDLYAVNPLTTRQKLSNQSNFYVCRPSWAPSVIVEASFVCNIQDFAWLINPAEQEKLADGMVQSILKYYGK